ncbi:TonB-dependent receptor domain-containing protein [Luteimonas sp. e5]
MATSNFRRNLKRSALTVALGLCFAGSVQAQSTVGSVFGQTTANETVQIENIATGATRSITAGADGRYTLTQLPPGRYRVTSGGATREVQVNVGSGTPVNFVGAGGAPLDVVTVTGTAYNANAIDVSNVESNTVFTAEQIDAIPVGRNVQSVALLAPSVVANSSYASNAPSFGGSASSENAYYINGYAVTNPLTSIGFTTLPFDGADQVEVLTGGYGAQYGRSTGGVISITTKRGTNDWKFGGAVYWTPDSLRGKYRDEYYPDTGFYGQGERIPTDGKLYLRRQENKRDSLQYGVYAGGPIIQDRLFFYAAADLTKIDTKSVRAAIPQNMYDTTIDPSTVPAVNNGYGNNSYEYPRWLAKLDWQINDNHSLEFTGVQDVTKSDLVYSSYDYRDYSHSDVQTGGGRYKDGGRLYIGKYVGHFTDNLSLSVLYGQQKIDHEIDLFGYDPNCPRLSGSLSNVKPGITGSQGCQLASSVSPEGQFDNTRGGRIDLEWQLGSHGLRLGYDDTEAHTFSGTEYAGGYVWVYMYTRDYNAPVSPGYGVGAPGPAAGTPNTGTEGWFVRRQYYTNSANVKTRQRAWYLEDRWQVTDNLLLSLGLRNENFTNYNGEHEVYVEQKNQWAPRLGFSWDVNGDSTVKVFGNAGRYHLALPNNVAARAAARSLYTQEYFNYTGIDPVTGAPTGLTNIPVTDRGYNCPGQPTVISSNLECGNARDPRVVAAKDLKPHYQDEYILGVQHQFSPSTTWGIKGRYRELRNAIDDTCTPALGGECYIFNPGIGNTFYEMGADGQLHEVYYSAEELDLPKLKRKYWAIETFWERSFSNRGMARVEYSFSRNIGNTEGQLHSDLDTGGGGQSDVSVTQDWDLPELMQGAYGLLPNHRAHQLKAYGSYRLGEDWQVGASAIITSGRPLSCTSYYPDPDAQVYNGAYYYWCGLPGTPGYVESPRGTYGTTPWSQIWNLNVQYRPSWAAKRLTLRVDVLNVFDQQKAQYAYGRYAANRVTPSRFFGQDLNYYSPRSVRLTARYDF